MTLEADLIDGPTEDPVANVLKWVLLVVAVVSFAILVKRRLVLRDKATRRFTSLGCASEREHSLVRPTGTIPPSRPRSGRAPRAGAVHDAA